MLLSLIVLIPTHTPVSLAVSIALVAMIGIVFTIIVLVGLARASISDTADRLGYGVCPLAAYLAMLVAAELIASSPVVSADVLAGALLVLLAVNIRNAWDLMLAFARRVGTQSPGYLKHDPEKACPGLDPGWGPVFGRDHAQTKIRAESRLNEISPRSNAAAYSAALNWGPYS